MKILKKICLVCLTLLICFCSCFKFINAFDNSFNLTSSGPRFQSTIGSADFSIGFEGESNYNDTLNFQTRFFRPVNLISDFAVYSVRTYGIDTKFNYNDVIDEYVVDQDIYFNSGDLLTYNLTLSDIYVEYNVDREIPTLFIDNGVQNIEQNYDLTYSGYVYNPTTQGLSYFEDTQPIQFDKLSNRYFTFSLENLCKNIVEHNLVRTDDSRGGLGFIKHLTLSINMLDSLNSSYPTIIRLDNMIIRENGNDFLADEFLLYSSTQDSPGVFGWLLNSINTFMSAELFPNFSIGVLLGTIVAVPILIYILKLFMGG